MMEFVELLDRPIAFHRCFVPVAGGVAGAVFLSQLLYWSKRIPVERNGWMWKTGAEWEEETGLRRGEQESARKKLRDAGVLEEELKGVPARLHFRLNVNKLASLLNSANKVVEFSKQGCGNAANKFVGIQQTNTETTSKNTSKNTLRLQQDSVRCDLIFPAVSQGEQKSMAKLIGALDCHLAQQILDEVSENIRGGLIRRTPIALCSGLVRLAKDGKFTPGLGVATSDRRQRIKQQICWRAFKITQLCALNFTQAH